jgi:RHS repeat-associated protein
VGTTASRRVVSLFALIVACDTGDPDLSESAQALAGIGPTDVIPGTALTPGPISASHAVTHGGQFEYSVPLWVVPGRADMQPTLAISYTSNGSTTSVGRGFALSGESAISRCQQTFIRDGAPRAIRFDDEDAFCLDGNRLVLVAGTNGKPGAQYATEVEDNRKIIIDASDKLGPTEWTIYHPSGLIDAYGTEATHRLEGERVVGRRPAVPVVEPVRELGGPARLRWLRASTTDRTGNGIRYEYAVPDGVTERVLTRIAYTTYPSALANRFVDFVYDIRPDGAHAFVNGLRIDQTRLLRQITTSGPAANGIGPVYRTYDLTYTTGMTGEPLLETFTECDFNKVCKRPLVFRWTTDASTLDLPFTDYNTHLTPFAGPSTNFGYTDLERIYAHDFNGDGADDLIALDGQQMWNVLQSAFVPYGWYNFWAPVITRFETTLTLGPDKSLPYEHLTRYADLNFDGRADLLYAQVPPTPPFFTWLAQYYNCVTQPSLQLSCSATESIPSITFASNAYIADFDGNGLPDLLRQIGGLALNGAPNLLVSAVALNVAAGQPYSYTPVVDGAGQPFETMGGLASYVLDLDGDRRFELVDSEVSGSTTTGWLKAFAIDANSGGSAREMNLATRYELQRASGDACEYPIFADVNGDGLVDAVVPGCTHAPNVFLNTGDGFLPSITTTTSLPSEVAGPRYATATSDGIRVFDVNRDGRKDLLYTHSVTGVMMALIAQADGRFRSQALRARDASSSAVYDIVAGDHGEHGPSINRVLDINGDGADDFIQFIGGELHVYLADMRPADRLASIEQLDAQNVIRVEYRSALDRQVVALDYMSTAVPQVETSGRGVWVVKEVTRTNGNGGSTLTESHTYRSPRLDINAGFLGFASHMVTDLASTTTYTFDLSRATTGKVLYPLRALPTSIIEESVYDGSGARGRTTTASTYAVVDGQLAGETVRVLPEAQTTTVEDSSNGTAWSTLTRKTRKYSSFDAYGNAGNVTLELWEPSFGAQAHTQDSIIGHDNYDTGSAWMLGRVVSVMTKAADPQGRTAVRFSTSTYDATTGALETTVISPNDPALYLEQRFIRDAFGNIERVERRDAGGHMRAVELGYDADSVYVTRYTNPLQQTETAIVQPGFGLPLSITDRNGVTTSQQLDGFGRTKIVGEPGGDVAYTRYAHGGSSSSQGVADIIERSRKSKSGAVKSHYDGFGRLLFEDTTDYQKRISRVTFAYDPTKGWLDTRTGPMTVPAVAGQHVRKIGYTRDLAGRMVKVDDEGMLTRHTYRGATRTTTDPSGHTSRATLGVAGISEILRFDPPRKPLVTQYEYGPFGLPTKATQFARNGTQQVSTYAYDALGRVSAMTDEAMTTTEYTYTPFDEVRLVTEKDANGQILLQTEATFDELGRMRTFKDLTSQTFANTYDCDTASFGVGQLARAESSDGVVTEYRYDGIGRLSSESTKYNGERYTFTRAYDSRGRLSTTSYPQPAGVAVLRATRTYAPITGVANKLSSLAVTGGVVWSLDEVDHEHRPTAVRLGNGLVDRRSYDSVGRLTSARTDHVGNTVRELAFTYYDNGNMKDRIDKVAGTREHFTHDFLDRLATTGYFEGEALGYEDATDYDDFGNIAHRERESELMTYAYGTGPTPHGSNAVTEVHSPLRDMVYHYDARGNQVRSSGTETVGGVVVPAPSRRIEYTGFDLPRIIEEHTPSGGSLQHTTTELVYDAFNQRFATRNITTGELVIERPGFRRVRDGGTDRWEVTLDGPFGAVTTVTTTSTGIADVTYLHSAAIGSLDTTTDASGSVVSRRAYTPFGEVRDPGVNGTAAQPLAFGFAGQRHDSQGLINMQGRIYDALTARFLTKDPRNTRPFDAQSYNRYSYVFNVPLVLTDSSGFNVDDWGDAHGAGAASPSLGDGLDPIPIAPAPTPPSAISPHAFDAGIAPVPVHVDDEPGAGLSGGWLRLVPEEDAFERFKKSLVQGPGPTSIPNEVDWIDVPDGNGVMPVPHGDSIPFDINRFHNVFNILPIGSWQAAEYLKFRESRPYLHDASYEDFEDYWASRDAVYPGIAPWEILFPGARMGGFTSSLSQVTRNRIAGNAFRDSIAEGFRRIGMEVRTEVYYRTVLGKRFADIVVSHNGVRLFNVECKLGSSVYTSMQQGKDALIWFERGIPTFVKSSGRAAELAPASTISRVGLK